MDLTRLQNLQNCTKVFVVGAPKSGTTWVQRLLDAHPDVVCSGEGHLISRLARRMETTVRQYNEELKIEAEQVYQGSPYYRAVRTDELTDLVHHACLLILGQRYAGERVIGDKTPRYAEYIPVLFRIFPDAFIVNIVRDPRDVAVSRLNHAFRTGYTRALTEGSDQRAKLVKNSIDAWLSNVRRADQAAAAHADRIYTLRYEDLLNDPAAVAGPVFEMLGVFDDPHTVDQAVAATAFTKMAGRVPGQESRRSFLRKGIAGDWKEGLTPSERDQVAARCHVEMAQHGYDPTHT